MGPRASGGLQAFKLFCKHSRQWIAKAWITPLAVIKNRDLFLDHRFGMSAPLIMLVMMHDLIFHAVTESFHWRIDVALPLLEMEAAMPYCSTAVV